MIRSLACLVAIVPMALRAQSAGLDLNNADVASIATIANDIANAIEVGDVNRIVDYYSPAAIYLADAEPIVDHNVGKAVVNHWRKIIGPNRAHIAIHIDEIDVSGNVAYDRITYNVTVFPRVAGIVPGQTGTPGEVHRSGHALEILRKEDGVWRYFRIMTNSSSSDQ